MLNKKLQELHELVTEINNIVDLDLEVDDDNIFSLFDEIANLRNCFNEVGHIPDIHAAEIIFEAYGSKDDLNQMYHNLDNEYPEFMNDFSKEKYSKNKNHHRSHFFGLWKGDYDELLRLTHHAEGLYENTNFENVHVEVCCDGKWYGKLDN